MRNCRAAEEPQENARDPPCPRTKRPSQGNCRSRNGVRRPRTDPATAKPVVVPAHVLAATPSRQIPCPGIFNNVALVFASGSSCCDQATFASRDAVWSTPGLVLIDRRTLARSVNDAALQSAPNRLRLEQDLAAAPQPSPHFFPRRVVNSLTAIRPKPLRAARNPHQEHGKLGRKRLYGVPLTCARSQE